MQDLEFQHRYCSRNHMKPHKGQAFLSPKEGEVFVKQLILISEWGFSFLKLCLHLVDNCYLDQSCHS